MDRRASWKVLSHLTADYRYRVAAAIRGPDNTTLEQAKFVFPARIRYLSRIVPTYGAIVRQRPLKKEDIAKLLEETAEWLPIAEQEDKLGEVIRDSFEHFFAHAQRALQALAELPLAFITEEERHEAKALEELAEMLKNRFYYTGRIPKGESIHVLEQGVRDWVARWYPDWGALPIE